MSRTPLILLPLLLIAPSVVAQPRFGVELGAGQNLGLTSYVDNVVLLPHLGSATDEARQAMWDVAWKNVRLGVQDLLARPAPAPRALPAPRTPRPVATAPQNGEVVAAMLDGEATVKTHVARVLMKLGLRDRVQAVIFAYESGLVQPGMG